tara:strand:+ start:864 stop:1088 length:225 start_codon:yes stop_codon:yes gene_type:complete
VTNIDFIHIGELLYDWDGLADGSVDATLEVWTEGYEAVIQEYLASKKVRPAGTLGVLGRNGWYMPKYAVDENGT